jgi:hypothetical protein
VTAIRVLALAVMELTGVNSTTPQRPTPK